VPYSAKHAPGTNIVNTKERYLYFVLGEGKALRYTIGVG
jgi:lipoprotein-anchoring transpeptidase ErfK/SrfK